MANETADQTLDQILLEDAKAVGVAAGPNAPAEALRAEWQAVEDFLKACPHSLGIEDHGMIRGVTYHPTHGLRLHERGGGRANHWSEIPDGILRILRGGLHALERQGIEHTPPLISPPAAEAPAAEAPAAEAPAAEAPAADGAIIEDTAPIPDDPEPEPKVKKSRR